MRTHFVAVPAPMGANDVDAYIPEQWAQAGLIQLSEAMVAANLVHRDFEMAFASHGDVVNTRRPREFKAYRKARGSNITIQDAISDNVAVPLDQHIHTSFQIHDVDASKSFQELESIYLVPAMRALARQIDITVASQAYAFRANAGGTIGAGGTVANLLAARRAMVDAKVPEDSRRLLLTPATAQSLLALDTFNRFDASGSTAGLLEASLGRKFGFDLFEAQNTPSISSTLQTSVTGAINNGAGYAAGTTVLTVDGFTGVAITVNSYVTVATAMRIYRVTAKAETSGNTTQITISPGLAAAVADNAVVTKVKAPLVNLVAGYAAGYGELIAYDGLTSGDAPQVGQLVSFGSSATSQEYTITQVNDAGGGAGTIQLDKPLAAAIANDDVINLGPYGDFNFAFHPHCLTLAIRPLAVPNAMVRSAVAGDPRLGATVRVTFSYDHNAQAVVCTCDFLAGIKVLNTSLGAVMYA